MSWWIEAIQKSQSEEEAGQRRPGVLRVLRSRASAQEGFTKKMG
jgi:hypothetical protein